MTIRIFHRPARVISADGYEDDLGGWVDGERRLPELEVVLEKQSAWFPWAKRNSIGPRDRGRARVIDLYTLMVDGRPHAHGPRSFVMQEAHRAAILSVDGDLPYWTKGATKRERYRRLRATQKHNDRRWHRKSNRTKRKAARRRWKRFVTPVMVQRILDGVFKDALYPKLMIRAEALTVAT